MSLRFGAQVQAVSRSARGLSEPALTRIVVVAGALQDATGRVLIAERPAGKHMAGRWEFPGGKIAPGETAAEALQRELLEEIGVTIGAPEFVMELLHRYPDREVQLLFHVVSDFVGEPQSLDAQRLRWVPIEQLHEADILEADQPFIDALQRRVSTRRSINNDKARTDA